MRLAYRVATFRYCTDLTAPEASSHVIAGLLVGSYEQFQIGLVLSKRPDVVPSDPLSQAIFADLPQFFKSHVQSIATQDPNASLDEIMNEIHNSLRNTIYVSAITERRELNLDESADIEMLASNLIPIVAQELRKQEQGGEPQVKEQRPSAEMSFFDLPARAAVA